MGAIEMMEDLVRRCCSRRDAQGNAHSLTEDIRMSSLEALSGDLEKHVQLNRARFTSYGVLREEIKTYCECARSTKRETERSRHTQEETTQWTLVHLAKGEGKQGQHGQHGQDRDKSKDKHKDSVECWNCGQRGHYSKDCSFKKNT